MDLNPASLSCVIAGKWFDLSEPQLYTCAVNPPVAQVANLGQYFVPMLRNFWTFFEV